MILSVSRRTDIPAHYAEWFLNRLKAGYVLVRNPVNHAQISRVTLSPDVIDCIVFWSKDPRNLLPYLPEIDRMGYRYYFQFTLTPYGKDLEPKLRKKPDIEQTLLTLSEKIGSERIVWRYDPIILNDTWNIEKHKEQFARMCEKFSHAVRSITISFVDRYPKLKTDLIRPLTSQEMQELGKWIGETAAKYHLPVHTCCETEDLTQYGVTKAGCINAEIVEELADRHININRDKNQRPGCGCCESFDIGVYNTCPYGCVYCYANFSPESTLHNMQQYDPNGELLIGKVLEGEPIRERKAQSNLDEQLSLFL